VLKLPCSQAHAFLKLYGQEGRYALVNGPPSEVLIGWSALHWVRALISPFGLLLAQIYVMHIVCNAIFFSSHFMSAHISSSAWCGGCVFRSGEETDGKAGSLAASAADSKGDSKAADGKAAARPATLVPSGWQDEDRIEMGVRAGSAVALLCIHPSILQCLDSLFSWKLLRVPTVFSFATSCGAESAAKPPTLSISSEPMTLAAFSRALSSGGSCCFFAYPSAAAHPQWF
jgi:hypothetical protein